jgi:flagellar basal body-associated protein FliL
MIVMLMSLLMLLMVSCLLPRVLLWILIVVVVVVVVVLVISISFPLHACICPRSQRRKHTHPRSLSSVSSFIHIHRWFESLYNCKCNLCVQKPSSILLHLHVTMNAITAVLVDAVVATFFLVVAVALLLLQL